MITIYHNGQCSKSRGALELLQEEGIPHHVRWYLAEPLSTDELEELLKKLGIQASELVRTTEEYYLENLAGKDFSESEWLEILVTHPELIERPIVVNGDKALIARPAGRIHEVL
jgi:arsenate reductase